MRAAAIALAASVALLLPATTQAAEATWSIAAMENQIMCPVCHSLLSQSNSTAANRIRTQIVEKHRLGWSQQRTKDWLVAQYGEEILAAPPASGFGLLAWAIPAAVLLVGAAVAAAIAVAWSRQRAATAAAGVPSGPLDADIERRIDRELLEDDT
jgi:cytochrome c-type biogenesis protein CcmH